MSVEYHLMIDMETMGVGKSGTPQPLTIGSVLFDINGDDEAFWPKIKMPKLYQKIDEECIEKYNLCQDPDIIEKFWAKQDEIVWQDAFDPENRIPLKQALIDLQNFAKPAKYVWSHGSIFDIKWIEEYYKLCDLKVPWQFHQIRDTRTLYHFLKIKPPKTMKHNALYDAHAQAVAVQNCNRLLQKIMTKI